MRRPASVLARRWAAAAIAFIALMQPLHAAAQGLPTGWTASDIGAPALAGSTSASNGVFTVRGAGVDVWGTRDQFHYVYRQVTGDADVIARVSSVQYAHAWTKAGVMMRASTDAASAHTFALVSAGSGIAVQARPSTGGITLNSGASAGAAPIWVKLERRGSTLKAYQSANGSTWTLIGSQTMTLPATYLVGIAVTSHDAGKTATATFDNVAVHTTAPSAPPPPSLPTGWSASDIGGPAIAGSSSASGDVFTVRGAGVDVWGTSDQFHYVYRQVTGDADVIARVSSLQSVDAWSKAGVMMRAGTHAGAAHGFALATPGSGIAFQGRAAEAALSFSWGASAGTAPVWLKLERRSNTLKAYRSADGSAWTLISSQTVTLPGSYLVGLAVTSHDYTKLGTAVFDNVVVRAATPPPASSLPAGWTAADIGAPQLTGGVSASNTVFTVRGAGVDIWDTSDQFHYVYRAVTGDVDVIARVSSVQDADAWTKAAVMMRAGASAAAAHGTALVTPRSGIAFQGRSSQGAISFSAGVSAGTAPVWLKLERRSSTLRAYRSANGSMWTLIGSQVVALPASYLVGLAVTSHAPDKIATAVFDNVTIRAAATTQNEPPVVSLVTPAQGATLAAPATLTMSAEARDPDGTIRSVEFYAGSTLIGTTAASPYTMSWSNVPAGSYSLTAIARDDAGASTVSATRELTVTAATHPTRALFTPSASHDAVYYYVLQIFHAGDDPRTATALATRDVGKPAIVDGECAVDIGDMVAALPVGSYIATMSAVGRDGQVVSDPSPQFVR